MLKSYTPEMGDKKPEAAIEAQLSHYGEHYFLWTSLHLKGRGIKKLGQSSDGKNSYKVTERAFQALCQEYDVSMERYL